MKKIIRLTEDDIHRMVVCSVNKILHEDISNINPINYNKLEDIMLKFEPNSISDGADGVSVTTEWLVGAFAGRSFVSNNKINALKQMCDYFNRHMNHDSIVGNVVTKSGWPDLRAVENYLDNKHGLYDDFNENNISESAINDFNNSDYEQTLKKKYPNMEFEFDVDDDGTVTVLDVNTGKYYIGNGKIEYETVGLGYPNPNDYDSEAEGQVAYYSFYNCLKTIMQKIDNDKPDGIDYDCIETSEDEISEAIKTVVKNFTSI